MERVLYIRILSRSLHAIHLRILRTIESFHPHRSDDIDQARQISERLEESGIQSPVLTTTLHTPASLPARERVGRVQVTRVPVQFQIKGYAVSLGMISHLRRYDIIHSHHYRNFQTDCAFFLPPTRRNPVS